MDSINSTNSIFISNKELTTDSLDNKLTYTNIFNIIPEDSTESPLINWEDLGKIEWRWRILEFYNGKKSIEISFKTPNDLRLYYNKNGEWVNRDVPKIYDDYVIKTLYYYSDK